MNLLLFGALLTLAGAFFLVRNIRLYQDPDKLAQYMATSHKAKYWTDKYGPEKATRITRTYFLPLGIAMAAFLLGVGLFNLTVFFLT